MYSKSLYKRIKTKDGFKDFKHHASSWRNSKKLRQRNRRHKMKLDIDDLKQIEIEMEENEAVMNEMYLSLGTEHEYAGDRV